MSQITLKVNGITCSGCQKSIERVLNEMTGIQSVNVNLLEKKVTVGFQDNKTSVGTIKNAIEDIGYDVEG